MYRQVSIWINQEKNGKDFLSGYAEPVEIVEEGTFARKQAQQQAQHAMQQHQLEAEASPYPFTPAHEDDGVLLDENGLPLDAPF
ncbi:hypothetical protein JCM19236_5653 [Vibrio sp. JCM 19236]|nr:hypothetical protein JCM19236_5653 [Vibrio sp. JCM 19236]